MWQKLKDKDYERCMGIMKTVAFDDSNITWQILGDYKHLHYSILDVDSEDAAADALFKFAEKEKIFPHRHRGKFLEV